MADRDDLLDPEPTSDELRAAEALRDSLDADAPEDLVRALRAAESPSALPEVDLDAIVSTALASEPVAVTPDPELVDALTAAWRPAPIAEIDHEALVARAVRAHAPSAAPLRSDRAANPPRSNVVAFAPRRAAAWSLATLALAAGIMALVGAPLSTGRASAQLAPARSTQPLFDAPFKAGQASARIDRIALARASDYRANQFARWGVR